MSWIILDIVVFSSVGLFRFLGCFCRSSLKFDLKLAQAAPLKSTNDVQVQAILTWAQTCELFQIYGIYFNLFSFYVKALMMSSCWQFKLELKFYSSFTFLGSGEAVGRWARVKREFNWLKRFKHLQCVMRELTKERKNGMKKSNLFMIFFWLSAFWAPECKAEEVWTPGKW